MPRLEVFRWLEEHDFRVIRTFDEIPPRSWPRLKGIDPVKVEHLSIEEILCLCATVAV